MEIKKPNASMAAAGRMRINWSNEAPRPLEGPGPALYPPLSGMARPSANHPMAQKTAKEKKEQN